MVKEKTQKIKPKYSIWQNVCFMVRTAWNTHKRVLLMCVVIAAIQVALNLAQLYVTPEILEKDRAKIIYWRIASHNRNLFGGAVLATMCKSVLYRNSFARRSDVRLAIIRKMTRKTAETSYPNVHDPKILKLAEQTEQATSTNSDAAEHIWRTLTELLTNMVGFIAYLFLLSNLNVFLILLVAVTSIVEFFVSKHINEWEYRHREEKEVYDKEISYFLEKPRQIQFAKDVRIFGLGTWLRDLRTKSMKMLTAFVAVGKRYIFGQM